MPMWTDANIKNQKQKTGRYKDKPGYPMTQPPGNLPWD